MTTNVLKPLTDELAARLQELISVQERLILVLRDKREAMRRANVEGILAATRAERDLVQDVTRSDDARRDVVAKLCAAIGLVGVNRTISLRALVARLDPPTRERLLRLAGTLRERMLAVGESNRVIELVCREMMVHFKTMFSAMVQDPSEPQTYRVGGDVGRAPGSRVLDAVG